MGQRKIREKGNEAIRNKPQERNTNEFSLMGKAVIGQYFKTLKAAKKAFSEMPKWKQDNHSILVVHKRESQAFLITGNKTIEALEKNNE